MGTDRREPREPAAQESKLARGKRRLAVAGSAEAMKGDSSTSIIEESAAGNLSTGFFVQFIPWLTTQQKNILETNGFHFILHLVKEYRPSLLTSQMAMLAFNEETSEMDLGDGTVVRVDGESVARVLGLPQGKALPGVEVENIDVRAVERVGALFGFKSRKKFASPSSCINVDKASEMLCSLRGNNNMSDEETEIFVKAVVLMTVANLLNPTTKRKYIEPRAAQAIDDFENIFKYDWAGYTLECLKTATANFKAQLAAHVPGEKIEIGGCTLFLQVIHLTLL